MKLFFSTMMIGGKTDIGRKFDPDQSTKVADSDQPGAAGGHKAPGQPGFDRGIRIGLPSDHEGII